MIFTSSKKKNQLIPDCHGFPLGISGSGLLYSFLTKKDRTMGCFEDWPTVEEYDSNDFLNPKITVPDNCIVLDNVAYSVDNLPSDLDIGDLCDYDENDYIVVITFKKQFGCSPTRYDVDRYVLTNLQKSNDVGAQYVQIVVHNKTSGKTKGIKRTSSMGIST